ncbi:sigma-70 family RNA polymerase sigma factor [Cryobacterium sp. SO2]|uniref:RNA polymerase sigma factor n=1 Tax=Cryobacterium sp. SO2 TaxID=1897060 RepID=UPI00223D5F13|nr:sigma-70 family RNA polymerase sigma factor [Cryobacterium sp. SO2]WEO76130.1 sigma-70 family RNA polymerase sigma factor [Cryobacterium sp. SO2]
MSLAASDDRLEALIRANASDLLAYLERRIDPRADAADVLSETFIVAWRKARTAPTDEIGGRMWLFAIARNLLLNARRSTRRRLAATDRLRHELDHPPAPTDDLETLAVRDAVAQLPAALRELVELVHWEGFSIVEAAQVSGVSASTARSRYASAKGRLRIALATETEDSIR